VDEAADLSLACALGYVVASVPQQGTNDDRSLSNPKIARTRMNKNATESTDVSKVMARHEREMQAHREMTLWAHYANLTLGIWLITSPFALGYLAADWPAGEQVLRVTAERGLADPALRNQWVAWSEIASGLLVVLFSLLSLGRRFAWAQWANACVGVWLLFAPLLFWAPSAAAYANDTLVGCLVIAFAVLVPMMPGMSMQAMALGPDVPPGWDYSPSDWLQRLPIIGFAAVGFFIARYLTAYQLGHLPGAWDPFFGSEAPNENGTEFIVTSYVSAAWPIPDAGLGAVSYALEALSGAMGDRRRWRTMPWMVALFGVLVVPLGAVSIFFIIIQPILLGTWCTLCFVTAAAMIVMIPYSLDELVAMGQFLVGVHRQDRSWRALWNNFWHGGVGEGGRQATDSEFDRPLRVQLQAMAGGGVSYPWTLVLCAAIGAWLLCSRLLLGTAGAMANSDHLVGALVITITFSAFAEVARPLRFLNLPFGAWLIAAPWLLDGAGRVATIAGVAAGVLLILLSLPRGTVRQRYGRWDLYIL
jgi:hypothetical protein